MNLALRVLGWLCLLIACLKATSVAPRDFQCLVCGKPFVDTVLMSYNSFGYQPPRDQVFRPPFAVRAEVRICPHDLFASWEYRWHTLKPGEKERLLALLKQPAVVLTDEERKIAGTDPAKLKACPWWEIWWARTCDQAREPDGEHQRSLALSLYYAGNLQSPDPWIRDLSGFYRQQAIAALAGAKELPERYLWAELMRQSGRTEEATAAFHQLVGDLSKSADKEDEEARDEREGIRDLCEEGIYLSETVAMPAGKLSAWLIPSFPEPDRNGKNPKGWSRHRIALQTLFERAASGDKEAQDQLWNSIAGDPKRLMAAHETLKEIPGAPESAKLIDCGGKWSEWLGRIAKDAASGKLPEVCDKDPDADNYLRFFKSFDTSLENEMDAKWRRNVLLPQVIKADEQGQPPQSNLSRGDLGFALGELAEEAPGNESVVGNAIVRFLKPQPEPGKEAPDYGVRLALTCLAKASAKPGAPPIRIDGEWTSNWWKLAAGYAVGKQDNAPKLARHALVARSFGGDGKAFENITYRLFSARKDPIWKERILKALEVAPWLPDEPIDYALSLEDKTVIDALQRRADRLRKKNISGADNMMSLYEIQSVEAHERSAKVAALTVR